MFRLVIIPLSAFKLTQYDVQYDQEEDARCHGESPRPAESFLSTKDILNITHGIGLMVSVYRSPCQPSVDKRLQSLVEISSAVGHEVITRDHVAINDSKIYAALVSENIGDDL